MRIVSLNPDVGAAVGVAEQVIVAGGTLIYPTDTVYGIGCDATCRAAVEKIIAMKRREEDTRFIVLVDSFASLELLVEKLPNNIEEIIRDLIPAPVTFVLNSSPFTASHIKGCEQTIAVRVPDHEFCLRLCRASGVPVLSTSANLHGEPVGSAVADITPELLEQADLVIDGGNLSNKPSTVVRLSKGKFSILREGAFSREDLVRRIGGDMVTVT